MTLKIGVGLFTGQIPPGSERTLTQEYRDVVALAKLTEEAGLDAAWVSEHHFSADGYLPSLLPLLAACATVTERIELGTGVILAPFHDPIRLAEDFAVVDQLAGGRLIAGLAVGWRDEEFRQFGIEVSSRVRRLIELVDVMRLAWTQDRFDYEGRYHSYSGVAVTPKPARVPPILVGGFIDDAVRRAGRIGDGFISSRVPAPRVRESFAMAAAERAAAGHDGPPIVGLLHNAFVTEDPVGDWPLIRAGAGHQLGTYAGWAAGTDVPGTPLEVKPPAEAELRASIAYGTPDEVVKSLTDIVEAMAGYPTGHLVLRLHYPGMTAEPAARAIELLGEEVAPRLRAITARR